jgi:hypothetical protein
LAEQRYSCQKIVSIEPAQVVPVRRGYAALHAVPFKERGLDLAALAAAEGIILRDRPATSN